MTTSKPPSATRAGMLVNAAIGRYLAAAIITMKPDGREAVNVITLPKKYAAIFRPMTTFEAEREGRYARLCGESREQLARRNSSNVAAMLVGFDRSEAEWKAILFPATALKADT